MYNYILVPLDGSKLSEKALAHVKVIAKGCGKPKVTLLTVLESSKAVFPEALYNATMEQAHREWVKANQNVKQNAEKYLVSQAKDLKEEGLDVKTVVIQADLVKGAADIIIDYAKANKTDLIIMSTHGRSGVSRWTLGSVTDKVIRHAGITVLTST